MLQFWRFCVMGMILHLHNHLYIIYIEMFLESLFWWRFPIRQNGDPLKTGMTYCDDCVIFHFLNIGICVRDICVIFQSCYIPLLSFYFILQLPCSVCDMSNFYFGHLQLVLIVELPESESLGPQPPVGASVALRRGWPWGRHGGCVDVAQEGLGGAKALRLGKCWVSGGKTMDG